MILAQPHHPTDQGRPIFPAALETLSAVGVGHWPATDRAAHDVSVGFADDALHSTSPCLVFWPSF